MHFIWCMVLGHVVVIASIKTMCFTQIYLFASDSYLSVRLEAIKIACLCSVSSNVDQGTFNSTVVKSRAVAPVCITQQWHCGATSDKWGPCFQLYHCHVHLMKGGQLRIDSSSLLVLLAACVPHIVEDISCTKVCDPSKFVGCCQATRSVLELQCSE